MLRSSRFPLDAAQDELQGSRSERLRVEHMFKSGRSEQSHSVGRPRLDKDIYGHPQQIRARTSELRAQ